MTGVVLSCASPSAVAAERHLLHDGPGGLWVRSRLIKGEIDDPFDDRFHALERDGRLRLSPGNISWNVWLDEHWRQMAIVQARGWSCPKCPASGGTARRTPAACGSSRCAPATPSR